jgi:cytochrome c oxidase assembly protein subunit 11
MRDPMMSLKLAGLAAAMFAFGFALVPAYGVFCDLTGFGGRTAATPVAVAGTDVADRDVRLEFISSIDRGAPFEFRPTTASMEVKPGKLYETTYWARNLTDQRVISQAVPSVAPGTAAKHLKKVECFCFTEQVFEPGEAREMGVTFMIDPGLSEHTDTLTLAYTLFAVRND